MSVPHHKPICQLIKLKPKTVAKYKSLHGGFWLRVSFALEPHYIVGSGCSSHYHPPLDLLTATFKYTGDYEKDMQGIAEDKGTQRWWKVTDGMQESLNESATGSGGEVTWWTELEEIFKAELA
ncbi:rhamnose mutarotase [Neolentinus lepideus HHB14362 ss-1]|uniref:Rhamnose mutarotase n=1 Tax=Neolentinus lepideus HHB14362 ss-1 TaxID=1314782 RepID=A0A165RNI5_9AGAM|nr:rhamnose mutarotase [Neolentinus lepideus HHB14362 ss-1]